MKYLSVQQFRDEDTGVSLKDINDLSLARYIARAEVAVDAHMKFDLKTGGFEPHNVWIQRKWNDRTQQTGFPSYPVPVQKINRYRIQVSNLASGAGFFAGINPSDAIINQRDGYVEIVPVEAINFGLGEILMGLKISIVQMDCFVSFYLPFFGEQLINTGDNQNYKAVRGFWASTNSQALHLTPNQPLPIPPAVYTNGVLVSSGYTVDHTEGLVTFNSEQLGTAKITADYTATIPDTAREAVVRQVSHLLEQRALRKQGMGGVIKARNADQELMLVPPRAQGGSQSTGTSDVLCDDAAACLTMYEEIAIA